MPYPLFKLGLRGGALARLRQLEAATVAGTMVDPGEIDSMTLALLDEIHG